MTWYFITLIQSFVVAIVFFIDKIVISKWTKSPFQNLVVTGIFSLVMAVFIYFIKGINSISFYHILPCVLLGMVYMVNFIFYFKSMQEADVSKFIPLTATSNILILILAFILLKESFGLLQYFGIIMITLGAILMLVKKNEKLKWSPSVKYILIYVVMISLTSIAAKYLLGIVDYWTLFFYENIGMFITSLPIIFGNFDNLTKTINKYGKMVLGWIILNEILGSLTLFLILVAYSLGPVSLVNAFGSVRFIFVFFISLILSLFLPQILKEDYSNRDVVLQKVLATSLIAVGSATIFIK